MPLDDRSARIFEGLLPVLEAGLVLLVLAPAQLDLADGVATANQIVVAHLGNTGCSIAYCVFFRRFQNIPDSGLSLFSLGVSVPIHTPGR